MNPLEWLNNSAWVDKFNRTLEVGASSGNTINVKTPKHNVHVKLPKAPSLPKGPPLASSINPALTKLGGNVSGLKSGLAGIALHQIVDAHIMPQVEVLGRKVGLSEDGLLGSMFSKEDRIALQRRQGKTSRLPDKYKKTEQIAGETADKHRPGAGFTSVRPSAGDDDGNVISESNDNNLPRTPEPPPTTLAGAYKRLGPRAVGDMTWGRVIGQPNNTGFIEPTEEMLNETASMWNSGMGIDPSSIYTKPIQATNPGMYNSGEGLPAGVGFNDVDLNTGYYDTVLPSSQPKTGLQALRADEKSKGLLYASGKYWAENADGKLEAIPTDLIDGEGTARQQAIAFMENKRANVIEAQKEAPQEAGVLQDPDRQNELSRALAQNQAWEEQQKGYGPEIYKATEGPVTLESFQPYVSEWPMGDAQSMLYQYQDLREDQGLSPADAFAKATRSARGDKSIKQSPTTVPLW